MMKRFLPYDVDQQILLPTNLRDWLSESHLALFVMDVVQSLDISAIYQIYNKKDRRGRLAYNPRMMLSLLIYAYCIGIFSSRKIEKATMDDIAFRVLSGDQHPDHDSIDTFRRVHLKALCDLFTQVLQLCKKAGLVKLGHISIDGSKIQANASKHKAMSYERMGEKEKALEQEIIELLATSQRIDDDEDKKYGKGVRGDELPAELARRETRLAKIREAKAALEQEAAQIRAEGNTDKNSIPVMINLIKMTIKKSQKNQSLPQAIPKPKSQKNFTDPESRIMPSSTYKGSFMQAYNAQIAVDTEAQIIVATGITQQANDKQQLICMAETVIANCGELAVVTSVDAGYFSELAVMSEIFRETKLLVPANRQHNVKATQCASVTDDRSVHRVLPDKLKTVPRTAANDMRDKLAREENKNLYKMRKTIVEPVFGQIKEIRHFRRFSMRGLASVRLEFDFVAVTHNLLQHGFESSLIPFASLLPIGCV